MPGFSRDSFYWFKELYDKASVLAWPESSRKKPILANRTAPEIEARIIEFSLEQPAFGQIRKKCTTMIVALPRKLLIALWRFVATGDVPQGVVLRPAT